MSREVLIEGKFKCTSQDTHKGNDRMLVLQEKFCIEKEFEGTSLYTYQCQAICMPLLSKEVFPQFKLAQAYQNTYKS